MGPTVAVLKLVPEPRGGRRGVELLRHGRQLRLRGRALDVSLAMAELSLLPAVRKAAADTLIVADGTSCRHQIADGAGRDAIHVIRVLEGALDEGAMRKATPGRIQCPRPLRGGEISI